MLRLSSQTTLFITFLSIELLKTIAIYYKTKAKVPFHTKDATLVQSLSAAVIFPWKLTHIIRSYIISRKNHRNRFFSLIVAGQYQNSALELSLFICVIISWLFSFETPKVKMCCFWRSSFVNNSKVLIYQPYISVSYVYAVINDQEILLFGYSHLHYTTPKACRTISTTHMLIILMYTFRARHIYYCLAFSRPTIYVISELGVSKRRNNFDHAIIYPTRCINSRIVINKVVQRSSSVLL